MTYFYNCNHKGNKMAFKLKKKQVNEGVAWILLLKQGRIHLGR